MARFALDVVYSGEKAARIGFVPRIGVQEGVVLTAQWARSEGLVS